MAVALLARRLGGAAPACRHVPLGHRLWRRNISVASEQTPNPDSVMFYPEEREVLGEGTRTRKFSNKYDTTDSPLAAAIFKVKGVSEVLLASKHVTVTKSADSDWSLLQPNVELVISQFYSAGLPALREGAAERDEAAAKPAPEPGTLEAQIVELLEERVRPFVQQDGGDVEFDRFDPAEGIVYVRMHGACSGCPSSNVTLQMGIKNLIEHYIPEVKDVLPVTDGDEDIPRPR